MTNHEFLGLCAKTAATLFSTALGGVWQVDLLPSDHKPDETSVWISFTAQRSLEGKLVFGLTEEGAAALAQRFMGEPADIAEFTPDQREAVDELFRQITGQLVTAMKSEYGEVQLGFLGGDKPDWTPAAGSTLRAMAEGGTNLEIVVLLDSEMAAALGRVQPSTNPPDRCSPSLSIDNSNLDLLMDVGLPVTVRFGQRQMRLSEVLDLTSGAVIELDRHVEDPVDLLVDGKVIARGEVVVVDGNFGLRVTEVASPGQRVRCFA